MPTASDLDYLHRRFYRPLLSFFRRKDPGIGAEDLAQEVFVRLARHPSVAR